MSDIFTTPRNKRGSVDSETPISAGTEGQQGETVKEFIAKNAKLEKKVEELTKKVETLKQGKKELLIRNKEFEKKVEELNEEISSLKQTNYDIKYSPVKKKSLGGTIKRKEFNELMEATERVAKNTRKTANELFKGLIDTQQPGKQKNLANLNAEMVNTLKINEEGKKANAELKDGEVCIETKTTDAKYIECIKRGFLNLTVSDCSKFLETATYYRVGDNLQRIEYVFPNGHRFCIGYYASGTNEKKFDISVSNPDFNTPFSYYDTTKNKFIINDDASNANIARITDNLLAIGKDERNYYYKTDEEVLQFQEEFGKFVAMYLSFFGENLINCKCLDGSNIISFYPKDSGKFEKQFKELTEKIKNYKSFEENKKKLEERVRIGEENSKKVFNCTKELLDKLIDTNIAVADEINLIDSVKGTGINKILKSIKGEVEKLNNEILKSIGNHEALNDEDIEAKVSAIKEQIETFGKEEKAFLEGLKKEIDGFKSRRELFDVLGIDEIKNEYAALGIKFRGDLHPISLNHEQIENIKTRIDQNLDDNSKIKKAGGIQEKIQNFDSLKEEKEKLVNLLQYAANLSKGADFLNKFAVETEKLAKSLVPVDEIIDGSTSNLMLQLINFTAYMNNLGVEEKGKEIIAVFKKIKTKIEEKNKEIKNKDEEIAEQNDKLNKLNGELEKIQGEGILNILGIKSIKGNTITFKEEEEKEGEEKEGEEKEIKIEIKTSENVDEVSDRIKTNWEALEKNARSDEKRLKEEYDSIDSLLKQIKAVLEKKEEAEKEKEKFRKMIDDLTAKNNEDKANFEYLIRSDTIGEYQSMMNAIFKYLTANKIQLDGPARVQDIINDKEEWREIIYKKGETKQYKYANFNPNDFNEYVTKIFEKLIKGEDIKYHLDKLIVFKKNFLIETFHRINGKIEELNEEIEELKEERAESESDKDKKIKENKALIDSLQNFAINVGKKLEIHITKDSLSASEQVDKTEKLFIKRIESLQSDLNGLIGTNFDIINTINTKEGKGNLYEILGIESINIETTKKEPEEFESIKLIKKGKEGEEGEELEDLEKIINFVKEEVDIEYKKLKENGLEEQAENFINLLKSLSFNNNNIETRKNDIDEEVKNNVEGYEQYLAEVIMVLGLKKRGKEEEDAKKMAKDIVNKYQKDRNRGEIIIEIENLLNIKNNLKESINKNINKNVIKEIMFAEDSEKKDDEDVPVVVDDVFIAVGNTGSDIKVTDIVVLDDVKRDKTIKYIPFSKYFTKLQKPGKNNEELNKLIEAFKKGYGEIRGKLEIKTEENYGSANDIDKRTREIIERIEELKKSKDGNIIKVQNDLTNLLGNDLGLKLDSVKPRLRGEEDTKFYPYYTISPLPDKEIGKKIIKEKESFEGFSSDLIGLLENAKTSDKDVEEVLNKGNRLEKIKRLLGLFDDLFGEFNRLMGDLLKYQGEELESILRKEFGIEIKRYDGSDNKLRIHIENIRPSRNKNIRINAENSYSVEELKELINEIAGKDQSKGNAKERVNEELDRVNKLFLQLKRDEKTQQVVDSSNPIFARLNMAIKPQVLDKGNGEPALEVNLNVKDEADRYEKMPISNIINHIQNLIGGDQNLQQDGQLAIDLLKAIANAYKNGKNGKSGEVNEDDIKKSTKEIEELNKRIKEIEELNKRIKEIEKEKNRIRFEGGEQFYAFKLQNEECNASATNPDNYKKSIEILNRLSSGQNAGEKLTDPENLKVIKEEIENSKQYCRGLYGVCDTLANVGGEKQTVSVVAVNDPRLYIKFETDKSTYYIYPLEYYNSLFGQDIKSDNTIGGKGELVICSKENGRVLPAQEIKERFADVEFDTEVLETEKYCEMQNKKQNRPTFGSHTEKLTQRQNTSQKDPQVGFYH